MTQQYIAGEMSCLLAGLRDVASRMGVGAELDALRREAETLPVTALRSVAVRAIRLADVLCWDSVTRGDLGAFDRQAVAAADLYEFGLCAGLLDER